MRHAGVWEEEIVAAKGRWPQGEGGGEKLGRQLEGLTLVGLTSMLKWVGCSADKGEPLTVSEQEIVIIRAGSLGRWIRPHRWDGGRKGKADGSWEAGALKLKRSEGLSQRGQWGWKSGSEDVSKTWIWVEPGGWEKNCRVTLRFPAQVTRMAMSPRMDPGILS